MLINEGVGVEVVEIKTYESSVNYFKAIAEIRALVKAKEIQMIHVHYSYCGLVVLLTNNAIPIILSLMGNDILGTPNFKGKLTHRGKMYMLLSKIIISRLII